jgi:hypothetical protein
LISCLAFCVAAAFAISSLFFGYLQLIKTYVLVSLLYNVISE